METKACTVCKQIYPVTLEYFRFNGGYWKSECRNCHRAASKKYHHTHIDHAHKKSADWRKENPGRAKMINAAWREENKEKVKKDHKEWYEANKEKVNQQAAAWAAANSEKRKEVRVNWRKKHPEQVKEYDVRRYIERPEVARASMHRRRSIILNAVVDHTGKDIKLLYANQKGKCWWCSRELNGKYDIDHRIPLSRGGSNNPENLVLACASCNRSKHVKLPQEFAGRLF